MKRLFRAVAARVKRRLLDWLAPEIRQIALEAAVTRAVNIARHETGVLRDQLTALQAIDVGLYRDAGKVIIIARVGGQDVVKVIDVQPRMEMTKYRDLVRHVEALYGVRPRWVDAGSGASRGLSEFIKDGR